MKHDAKIAKTTFGKRKLDPEAYAAQQAKAKRTTPQGVVFGNRKIDGPAAPVARPAPAPAEDAADPTEAWVTDEPEVPEAGEPSRNPFIPEGDEDGTRYVTVKELEATLAEDPALLKLAFEAEFRDGTPRKGAIAAMLKVAKATDADPRLLKLLEGHA